MKVLALDLMGVITVQQYVSFPKQGADKIDEEWRQLKINILRAACKGTISESELIEALGVDEDAVRAALDSVDLDPDAKALVDAAREKGIATCVLTNHLTRWADYLLNRFKIDLDYSVVSDTLKSSKPEKRIFDEVLRVTGAKPEEVLFVDDHARNLEAARKLGFKCVLMRRDERERFEPSVRRREVVGML
ncbi:MAG: HAD-IA family hydrolase [Candidatus Micrarchaeia archaeon]